MAEICDFIIVGGGTSGCLLASRLASTPSKPSVALLEGGPIIDKPEYRRSFERFSTIFQHNNLDYNYTSIPQKGLANRNIAQARGKGLGGSSAVNFQVWSLGAREEFEAWADAAGDEAWGFPSVMQKLKQLERLHLDELSPEWDAYIKPDAAIHGFAGDIDISIGNVEKETKAFFDAGVDLGHKLNQDPNDGDPIGFSLGPTTSLNNVRTTSASAFIENRKIDNLSVLTDCKIVKILFDRDRAIGVEKADGTQFFATKEVILCAGAIDSPKLLLLSGIGPQEDLETLGIKVVKNLPGVGKGFSDHSHCLTCFHMGPGFTDRQYLSDPAKYQEAVKQWTLEGSGPIKGHFSSVPHAFLKDPASYDTDAFKELPDEAKKLLLQPGVPNYELVTGMLFPPNYEFSNPDDGFLTVFVTTMNSQSRGYIKLASADPLDPPIIDPRYLDHPYDRIVLRDAIRETLKIVDTPTMKPHYIKQIIGPKSESDEDITDFMTNNVAGLWHPSCSVKIGKSEHDGSCVDKDLKVHGLKSLRVVDLSVTPLLPSGHPQVVAYITAQIAAEKIAEAHNL